MPDETTDREIVLFGTTGNTLLNSGVVVSLSKDLNPIRSATFSTPSVNPGGATTAWVKTADQRLYLGADPVGQITLARWCRSERKCCHY